MQSFTYIDIDVVGKQGKTAKLYLGDIGVFGGTHYKHIINSAMAIYIHRYDKCEGDEVDGLFKFLCTAHCPSMVLMTYYKRLPPIETIDEGDKRCAWETAKEFFPNADDDFKKRAAKIIYAFSAAVS